MYREPSIEPERPKASRSRTPLGTYKKKRKRHERAKDKAKKKVKKPPKPKRKAVEDVAKNRVCLLRHGQSMYDFCSTNYKIYRKNPDLDPELIDA